MSFLNVVEISGAVWLSSFLIPLAVAFVLMLPASIWAGVKWAVRRVKQIIRDA